MFATARVSNYAAYRFDLLWLPAPHRLALSGNVYHFVFEAHVPCAEVLHSLVTMNTSSVEVARRCTGTARSGLQCSITTASKLLDSTGHLAARPLQRGGERCSFHAQWFCKSPLLFDDCDVSRFDTWLLFFIDFETTGLSIVDDEICEIGVVAADSGAVFSTVVRPPVLPTDSGVHGICPEELSQGPGFAEAFRRLCGFFEELSLRALTNDDSSSDCSLCNSSSMITSGNQLTAGECFFRDPSGRLPRLRERPPAIMLAAHNGSKFDFPMLLSSCWRHNVPLSALGSWSYVDTLDLLRAISAPSDGVSSCLKLQCQRAGLHGSFAAHRALDDALVLAAVVRRAAESVDAPSLQLLARFAYMLDVNATAGQLAFLC